MEKNPLSNNNRLDLTLLYIAIRDSNYKINRNCPCKTFKIDVKSF